MEQQLFINTIKDKAIELQEKYKILASIIIAQAILESGWGTSELYHNANNSFGIKWADGCGYDTYLINTKEVVNGQEQIVQAYFRSYKSLADSIEDHAIFLQKDRYKNIIGDINYASVAQKLYDDGYSTSPVYPSGLLTLIEKYKLYQYDVKKFNEEEGNKMRIALRGGHSANCIGAVGVIDEYSTMQRFYNIVAATLGSHGHIVIDCNSNASDQIGELSEGAARANNANVDLFISLHMNASNGQGHGTEALIASTSSGSYQYAERLCEAFGSLGFTNRGVKVVGNYEMHHIAAPNIIFETCFCDNESDVILFNEIGLDQLALTFCKAIDGSVSEVVSVPVQEVKEPTQNANTATIEALQHILNDMGIKDNRSNVLNEDGIMGPKTLAALSKKAALVKKGNRSDLVRWVQEKIGVAADGIFGDQTYNAVCDFQSSHGLEADGIIGPNTWAALTE